MAGTRRRRGDVGGSDESANGVNHFARLPDELVLRIFSELDAGEAYEKNQLRSVDRRFRQLASSVHFKDLRLQLPLDLDYLLLSSDSDEALECFEEHRAQLDRFTARVRSKELAGCRRLVVGFAWSFKWDIAADLVSSATGVFVAITGLLEALSTAQQPLEQLGFAEAGSWRQWPSLEDQRALGIAAPHSLETAASAFLAALPPASLSSLHFGSEVDDSLFRTFLDAAATVPGCLPRLRELNVSNSGDGLYVDQALMLAEVWPRVEKISCSVRDGATLRALSGLPLTDVRVTVLSTDGLEGALEALRPESVRGVSLPDNELAGPGLVAPILRCPNLEELVMLVDHASGGSLAGLGALEKLRNLDLRLNLSKAPDGGAAALSAVTEGLAAARRFDRLELSVKLPKKKNGAGRDSNLPSDAAGLSASVEAARPSLRVYRTEASSGWISVTASDVFDVPAPRPLRDYSAREPDYEELATAAREYLSLAGYGPPSGSGAGAGPLTSARRAAGLQEELERARASAARLQEENESVYRLLAEARPPPPPPPTRLPPSLPPTPLFPPLPPACPLPLSTSPTPPAVCADELRAVAGLVGVDPAAGPRAVLAAARAALEEKAAARGPAEQPGPPVPGTVAPSRKRGRGAQPGGPAKRPRPTVAAPRDTSFPPGAASLVTCAAGFGALAAFALFSALS
eukprot:tig00021434_g21300.t1